MLTKLELQEFSAAEIKGKIAKMWSCDSCDSRSQLKFFRLSLL
jgi:hypothetical protein